VVRRVRPTAGQRVEAGVVRPPQYGAGGGGHLTVREEEQYNTAAEIAAVEEREFEQILADWVLRDYGRE
jgi:hypothetical protein